MVHIFKIINIAFAKGIRSARFVFRLQPNFFDFRVLVQIGFYHHTRSFLRYSLFLYLVPAAVYLDEGNIVNEDGLLCDFPCLDYLFASNTLSLYFISTPYFAIIAVSFSCILAVYFVISFLSFVRVMVTVYPLG